MMTASIYSKVAPLLTGHSGVAAAMAVLTLIPGAALAQSKPTTVPEQTLLLGRPEADWGSTKVYVTMWVADIDDVDSAKQNYTANVCVALRWMDRRLAHGGKGPRRHDLNSIWNPGVLIANEIGMVRKTLPDTADVAPDGTVFCLQRYVGIFSQRLRLHDFPLDRHVMQFRLVSPNCSPVEVEFVPDDRWANPGGRCFAPGAGIADDLSLPDFDVTGIRTAALPYTAGTWKPVAGYVSEFDIQRHPGYLIWKLLVPLVLIVLMSWLVFWIDPANIAVRIGVGTTAMLTLVAYRLPVSESVPRVGYLTRMDSFVIGSSALIFLALCQVVFTACLRQTKWQSLALRSDRWSRLVYLVLLAALLVGSFVI